MYLFESVVAMFKTYSKPYCALGPVKVSIHSAGDVFVGFGESTDWVGLVKQPPRGNNHHRKKHSLLVDESVEQTTDTSVIPGRMISPKEIFMVSE